MRNQIDDLISKSSEFSIHGTNRIPLDSVAYYLANSQKIQGPQLVVTENLDEANRFKESFSFWSKKTVHVLPTYDPTLYSGVQLSPQQVHDRVSWLFHAFNENDSHIFVAPIMGLLQKTLPAEIFMDHCFEFSVGDQLPEDIFEKLSGIGYFSSPIVEDKGSFSNRGGIVDIFSPQMEHPVRIELFDDEIESIRQFDQHNQRTLKEVSGFVIAPAREVILSEERALNVSKKLLQWNTPELQVMVNHLRRSEYCENLEYYLPLFYDKCPKLLDYFQSTPTAWLINELDIETTRQKEISLLERLYQKDQHPLEPKDLFEDYLETTTHLKRRFSLEKVKILESVEDIQTQTVNIPAKPIAKPKAKKFNEQVDHLKVLLSENHSQQKFIFSIRGQSQFDRLTPHLKDWGYKPELLDDNNFDWETIHFDADYNKVYFVTRKISSSFHLNSEKFSIISFEQYFGKLFQKSSQKTDSKRGKHLSFGEIKEGDYVIHAIHGVCQFTGLKTMVLSGVEGEFLTLEFKEKDKLFLPIYRIHQIYKYSSEKVSPHLDKLGGNKFSNVKTKTKKRLREMAHELVKLYAQRKNCRRLPYDTQTTDVFDFFNAFPYQETQDQVDAIQDILNDLASEKPMDRLICGDVGFGKTEVAMRAAFIVAANKKQVAVLAPTTVLTMQHYETFRKRFKDWPLRIEVINRLQSTKKVKEVIQKTKDGEVDILIGTHRLLSQDIGFKELGILILDEEQKFGVKHKEKIKQMKVNVDTLALSATPIPRTLNMSLLGIRDLSLINTAPVDRLETRTFICRHDKEIIKRAVETEVQRGGQVFFLHNRVQSIYSIAEELRQILPNIKIGVGHGQLKEKELESVMVSFFNNEIDVLIASTIVESGVDIPNANTILINQADKFGLSQLYQLRGRVGRSGRRAYCYLLTDPHKKLTDIAKERLKVIQENTALGSGMQIAHYDLELRGSGTLLGEEQSGLIDNVGYEFYMELLEEAIKEAKGQDVIEAIEPEMNLKIKAFIPNSYISNIKLRLSYYRALTLIESDSDIDDLEEELRDQFGKPPEEVINLLGLMLIRRSCILLGVKDISSGKESLVLSFTEQTPLPAEKVVELTSQNNKKYNITPDYRLKIRLKDITWPKVYDEVSLLLKYCPKN